MRKAGYRLPAKGCRDPRGAGIEEWGDPMHSPVRKKTSSLFLLTLLALLALAIGAQAVLAASSGTTSAAGTEGRGGTAAIVTTSVSTPAAGTEGRGGAATTSTVTVVAQSPAAGTEGRGGAAVAAATAPTAASTSNGYGVWIAVGAALAALIVGFTAWIVVRRRRPLSESSLSAYCARHPQDSACLAA